MAALSTQIVSQSPFNQPPSVKNPHTAPSGTFLPSTKVQVGNHRVIIEKYLSEGGYAHVYVVRLPKPVDGNELAVLKRVAVPDKESLANMRTEVETMKRLRGKRQIVKYIDSHASGLKSGGYEVFLLMEYCSGGGLIDFMNTRLQQRLTEPEILRIFTDVAEGVASMHYLKPPLLHRDIKVENVLIALSGSSKSFKLCDFGSAAPPRPAATTAAEARLIEDDVQRHTTLQYRSPEMIDVYRKHPIDEKSDIWALGVFLYKLCYYTTPFEEVGQMAILNATFKYPGYPKFSDQLKLLIASMLKENPMKRPNIYQVLHQACQLQGKEVPITDIYIQRSQSESRKTQHLPNPSSSQSRAGATLSPPTQQQNPTIPDITPMRRGRPEKPISHHGSAKPSPSPLRMIDNGDPFATLDGDKVPVGDELSSRFPTLDQFSLLTESGHKFEFDSKPAKGKDEKAADLASRVTSALADQAFVRPPSPPKPKPTTEQPSSVPVSKTVVLERKRSMEARDTGKDSKREAPTIPQKPVMVSTGTMTASPPPISTTQEAIRRPIHRFPSSDGVSGSSSSAKALDKYRVNAAATSSGSRLANLLKEDALRSQPVFDHDQRSPTSSRPSLEGGRPSAKDLDADLGLSRSKSLNLRARPVSVNIGERPTHVNDRKIKNIKYGTSAEKDRSILETVDCDTNINSDIDFLKAKEEEGKGWQKHHRILSGGTKHIKRSSLPSISMAGTKNLLSGRFGDVFRKFEQGHQEPTTHHSGGESPSLDPINVLTPIAGSEATDLSEERPTLDDTEDLSPEMRRELEKRRLEAEERRVAAAAAEYRRRIADTGGGGGRDTSKAVSIQNKVQSLLKENDKPTVKTAAGYGRFTDSSGASQMRHYDNTPGKSAVATVSPVHHVSAEPSAQEIRTVSAPPSATNLPGLDPTRVTQRPVAPPKPQVLRTGGGRGGTAGNVNSSGVPLAELGSPGEDWEANFNKRYPSLSGLELVEREIDVQPKTAPLRTKEV